MNEEKKAIRAARMARIDRMLVGICERHGVTKNEVLGRGRTAIVASARNELMAQLWRSGVPLAEIGRLLDRDHTTVLAGVRRALGVDEYRRETVMRKVAPVRDDLEAAFPRRERVRVAS